MKPDLYTKVVLSAIAIFLGVIAFEYRPVKSAKAATSGSTIVPIGGGTSNYWQLDGKKVRFCYHGAKRFKCYIWR